MRRSIGRDFAFITGEPDLPNSGHISRYIFNRPEFLDLHHGVTADHFYLIREKDAEVAGHIAFQHIGEDRVSLGRATFGSVEIHGRVRYDAVSEFIRQVLEFYGVNSCRSILIRHYATIYDPYHAPLIAAAFSHNGFKISSIDINHHLGISETPFEALIHPMERRQLNKCLKAGYLCRPGKPGEHQRIYHHIVEFRQQRKIPVTFPFEDFSKSLDRFPEHYIPFQVLTKENELLAAAILIKTAPDISYYFFPADNPLRMGFSPMILLMQTVYEFSKANGARFIDLGVSSKNDRPQTGLIHYKENLGGIPSTRLNFQLDLR